jgi:hypothetical protein
VFLWALAALAGVIALVLIVAGVSGSLTSAGWGIAVVLLVLAVLAGTGAVSLAASHPCPRCGKGVRVGVVVCPTCGFDFATAAPRGGQLVPSADPDS